MSHPDKEGLRLVADGSSLREIGEQLAIAEPTVRTHLSNTNRKLGARNRAHAVALAATTQGPPAATESSAGSGSSNTTDD
jgi:ATP/maltotriose-dependent transcriptional regulator MalT